MSNSNEDKRDHCGLFLLYCNHMEELVYTIPVVVAVAVFLMADTKDVEPRTSTKTFDVSSRLKKLTRAKQQELRPQLKTLQKLYSARSYALSGLRKSSRHLERVIADYDSQAKIKADLE